MSRLQGIGIAGCALVGTLGMAGMASAYTAPYATPQGITVVDVSKIMDEAIPQFLWRRLGDAQGNPLYTYEADQSGRSSCYEACAKEFPPFVADSHARASGDFSIIRRDDQVRQWAYQGHPLYRYSGKDPAGEPVGARFELRENPAWHDPGSAIYSPKRGWKRAALTPEHSIELPPNLELAGEAVAGGFGLIDAATHMTIYAAPVSHKLSEQWEAVRASALAVPVGQFSILTRKDGTRQWTYRGEALYRYAGDYAPDEATGLFSGDKSVQAALVYRTFMPEGVRIGEYPGRGPLLTTDKGLTLYTEARYQLQYGGRETRTGYSISYNEAKSQGTVGCEGQCTVTWKPLLAPANAQPQGFWEVIKRADGAQQWLFKGSPVYSFIGDKRPGDIEGNNRHVIVYGGAQGQIVYSNPGDEPRDPKPLLGQLDMIAAAGPRPNAREEGGDAPPQARPASSAPAGAAKAKAGAGAAGAGFFRGDRRAGAGFYWHTAVLFY